MKVAIVGCGYIADHYARSIRGYPILEPCGVTDRDQERARHFGEFYGLPVYPDLAALLADPAVEMVLNLTNPRSHYQVSKACLEAGKHVYTEKPVAMELGQAKELVALAAARGLRLSGAPCSILGESAQTMWKALREKAVGRVRAVYAEMDDGLLHRMPFEKWRSESGTPWPYKDEFEVGCTMEHAGYCLTWMLAFFGPARSVTAFSSVQIPEKHPDVRADDMAPDLSVATVLHESGVVSRMTCSVIAPADHLFRVLGDEGVIWTPDVWHYDAPIYSRRWIRIRRRQLLTPWRTRHKRLAEPGRKLAHDDRARGPAELAAAIAEGRESRISADFALHVTELTLAVQQAGTSGGAYRMTTSFAPIEPMAWGR